MAEPSSSLAVVDRLIAGWEARDPDAVAACFPEDGVWHNMPYAPLVGRVAIRGAAAKFLEGMTAARFDVRHSGEVSPGVVMNERVDIFWREDGTELRFAVMGVFEVRGGLIAVWRDYFDSAVMAAG